MAAITKINWIQVITNPIGALLDSNAAKKFLSDAVIESIELSYVEPTSLMQTYSALSSWCYGRDNQYRVVNQLPVVIWREHWDDGRVVDQIAIGKQEIMASSLVANRNLISPIND